MTNEELLIREAIRDTLARYNIAGDRMRVDDFVGVFTDDAVYESDGFRQEGRAEIRRWLTERAELPADAPRVRFVRHHITTCQIDVAGPAAAAARAAPPS